MRARIATVVLALPVVTITVAWIVLLTASAVTGEHPWWHVRPDNLAEAAAFRDTGAVIRMIDRGDDVHRPGRIRPGVLGDDAVTMTPFAAAAASREQAMVQLLLDAGVSPDADTWQRAWCVATASSVQEILQAHRPEGASLDCATPH